MREALVRLANNLVRDILTILVMVTVMVWFSWLLSLLVLVVIPLPCARLSVLQAATRRIREIAKFGRGNLLAG